MNFSVKKAVLFSAASLVMFTSCRDEEKVVDDSKLAVPSSYEFKDAQGNSTVSYSGQNARLAMASQLKSALGDPANADLTTLNTMFADGTGFENTTEVADVDGSGKKLRKTVAAAPNSTYTPHGASLKTKMDGWIEGLTQIDHTAMAANGTSGYVTNPDGTKKAYLTPEGIEINQAVAKTIIGAICLDQVINKYISQAGLQADIANVQVQEGKNYTNLEHHWDEAYGYVFGTVNGDNVLLGKYLGSVDGLTKFAGIKDEVKQAFLEGRTAIVNEEYDLMEEKAALIREKLSLVVAVKLVHYLDGSIDKTDMRGKFHGLSEAYGFAHAMYFAHVNGTQAPKNGIDQFIAPLENLWTLNRPTVDYLTGLLTGYYGFTVAESHN